MKKKHRINLNKLKMERGKKGWSQADLAEQIRLLGVPPLDTSTINRIETGKQTPHIKTIHYIARALKIKPETLIIWVNGEESPLIDYPEATYLITQKVLLEKIESQARTSLQEKLHDRIDDYLPLNMEIRLIKEKNSLTGYNIENESKEKEWYDFSYSNLLNPQNVYIISSETGTGKTTLLRNIQLNIIKQKLFMPIMIHASEIENQKLDNKECIIAFLANLFKSNDHQNEDIEKFFEKNFEKVILLVDGLDQIRGTQSDCNQILIDLTSIFKTQLIIASRPFAVTCQDENNDIKFIRLKSFNLTDKQNYFSSHYNIARKLCKSCPEMMSVPMLAYMVRTLIEKNKYTNINNRYQLYKSFVDFTLKSYKHERIESNPEMQNQIILVLGEICYKALSKVTPYIQKIPLDFYVENINHINISLENILKHGLVGLMVERVVGIDEYLYFSHQSFQEYFAAEHISKSDDRIKRVISEKLNPKWKEVIKFLTGINGQEIVELILSEKDNTIHSNLFLAADCCTELQSPAKIEEHLLSELQDLLKISLFEYEALSLICKLNINKAIEFLLMVAEGKTDKIDPARNLDCQISSIQMIDEFKNTMTISQKQRFMKLAMTSEEPLIYAFDKPLKNLILNEMLDSQDIEWAIENMFSPEIYPPNVNTLLRHFACKIQVLHVDRIFYFFEKGTARQKTVAYCILDCLVQYEKIYNKHINKLFDLLKKVNTDSKIHILDIVSLIKHPNELKPEVVDKIIFLLFSSEKIIRDKIVDTLEHWLGGHRIPCDYYVFSQNQLDFFIRLLRSENIEERKIAIKILQVASKNQDLSEYVSYLDSMLYESNLDIKSAVLALFYKITLQKDPKQAYSLIQPRMGKFSELLKIKNKEIKDVVFNILYYIKDEMPDTSFLKHKSASKNMTDDFSISFEYPFLSLYNKNELKSLLESEKETDIKKALKSLREYYRNRTPIFLDKITEMLTNSKNNIVKSILDLLYFAAKDLQTSHIDVLLRLLEYNDVEIQVKVFNIIEEKGHDYLIDHQILFLLKLLKQKWESQNFLSAMLLLDNPKLLTNNTSVKILISLSHMDKQINESMAVLNSKLSDSDFSTIERQISMSGLNTSNSCFNKLKTVNDKLENFNIKTTSRLFDAINFSKVCFTNKINYFLKSIIPNLQKQDIHKLIISYMNNPVSKTLEITIDALPDKYLTTYLNLLADMIWHKDKTKKILSLKMLNRFKAKELDRTQINHVIKLMEDSSASVRFYAKELLKTMYSQGVL